VAVATYCVTVQPRTQRVLGPGLVGVGLVVATAYISIVDPNNPGHYPLCPLKAFTGLDCPGCGGMRAVHSLVHGDFVGAMNHNLLAVFLYLPAIAIGWLLWMKREWSDPTSSRSSAGASDAAPVLDHVRSRRLWLAAFIVIGIFTIIRNIHAVPAFDWLGSSV